MAYRIIELMPVRPHSNNDTHCEVLSQCQNSVTNPASLCGWRCCRMDAKCCCESTRKI